MHTRLIGTNSVAAKGRSWSGGKLTPGTGTTDLQVGQSRGQVETLLGWPDETRSFEEQFFYVYRSRGVDVDFGRSQQRVERLFFYGDGIEGHLHRAPVRFDGISFGSSRSQVLQAFGKPNFEGGPVRVARRLKSWICYDSGVEFDFDGRNRVIIIAVFNPQLRRTV